MLKKSQKPAVEEFSVFEEMGMDIFFLEKTRFDLIRWLVSHLWIFAFGPFLFLLLIDVGLGLFSPGRQVLSELLVDLTDLYYISLTVLIMIGGLIFRRLLAQTPRTFLELAKNRLIEGNPRFSPQTRPPGIIKRFLKNSGGKPGKAVEKHQTFSSKFRSDIMGRGRWVISVFFLTIGIPLIAYADRYRGLGLFGEVAKLIDPHTASLTLFLDVLWLYTRWVFTPVLWVIAFGPAIWILYTIGTAIKDLTPRFQLSIQPSHPDGCGGLRRLGDLCFNMALPIILAILLLGIWAIIGLRTDPQNPVTLFSIIGLILVSILSIIVFFMPLWDIHQEMLAKRTQYQDDLAERIDKTEKELRENFKEGKPGTLDSLTKELKALQELHPAARKYPTWPFDAGIFLKVISPSTLSLLGVVFSLNKETVDGLNSILQAFMGLIGQGK